MTDITTKAAVHDAVGVAHDAAHDAVNVAHVHPFLPPWLQSPPIGTPGYSWFPFALAASLALLIWTIFFYDPGPAGNSDRSDTKQDNSQ